MKIRQLPPILFAYGLFALAATAADLVLVLLGTKVLQLQALVLPVIGWSSTIVYLFSLISVYRLARDPNPRDYRALLLYLLLGIGFGVFDFVADPPNVSDNPWLAVSPWRPVWTIGVPALWLFLLLLPAVRRFSQARLRQLPAE